jgi:hypothetical protein
MALVHSIVSIYVWFQVTGPESKQLYESSGKSEATFSFVADKVGNPLCPYVS